MSSFRNISIYWHYFLRLSSSQGHNRFLSKLTNWIIELQNFYIYLKRYLYKQYIRQDHRRFLLNQCICQRYLRCFPIKLINLSHNFGNSYLLKQLANLANYLYHKNIICTFKMEAAAHLRFGKNYNLFKYLIQHLKPNSLLNRYPLL